MPLTSNAVINTTIRQAGILQMTGIPKMLGASCTACHVCLSPGSIFSKGTPLYKSADAFSKPLIAERKSRVDHAGRFIPKPFKNPTKYPDQLMATAIAPTPYSIMRSQPIIHATNSPNVAYEYV